jgi:tetratricopeptide (TPR) repeat protein
LLFAVHPVHVEAVANIVGRSESMATVFVIGALLLHSRRNALSVLLFALALASKESAMVFIGLAFAWDVVMRRDWLAALRERRWMYAGYLAIAIVYAITLALIFRGKALVAPASTWMGASTGERLLTVVSIIPHYVRLMIAPFELSADYNPRVITLATHLTAQVLTGFVLIAIIVLCLVVAWQRSRVAFYALAWFAIAVSPVSNVFFASGIALAERTLYLPSVGFVLLAGLLFEWSAQRRTQLALVGAAVVLLIMAARTWTRVPVWKDNRTLVLTTLADHPESYKVHQQAGGILLQIGDSAGSAREYGIAASLFNKDPYFYREVAEAALRQRDFHRALAMLDTSISMMPNHPSPWMRVADARFNLGQYPQAIAAARQGYKLARDSVRALIVIAVSSRAMGDLVGAAKVYREALAEHPRSWELHSAYADLLLAMGDIEAARREAALGVELSRGASEARAIQQRAQAAVADSGSMQRTVQETP